MNKTIRIFIEINIKEIKRTMLTSLIIAVDSGFDACPSAGLGLGAILLRVRFAGTVPSEASEV